MYKIAVLCTIAIGIPHYVLAETAQVSCQSDGEEIGTLFEGKSISVDKKGKSKFYSPAELTKRCRDLIQPSEKTDADNKPPVKKNEMIKAVLK